jgi:DNA-binding NtrC family response regulator
MSKFVALVVEDDVFQRETLCHLLKDKGLEVVECSTAEAAEIVLVSTAGTPGIGDRCFAGRRYVRRGTGTVG